MDIMRIGTAKPRLFFSSRKRALPRFLGAKIMTSMNFHDLKS